MGAVVNYREFKNFYVELVVDDAIRSIAVSDVRSLSAILGDSTLMERIRNIFLQINDDVFIAKFNEQEIPAWPSWETCNEEELKQFLIVKLCVTTTEDTAWS
jgi:hypothetical protein